MLVLADKGSGVCVCFLPVPPLQKHTYTHSHSCSDERRERSSNERLAELIKWRSCRTDAFPRRCCKCVEILLALPPVFLSTLLHFILQWGTATFMLFQLNVCAVNSKPEGPGTGVDKLSSGCCLVSMGVLSYTALFFSLYFTRLPCESLQKWMVNALHKKLALFVRVWQTIVGTVIFC